MANNKTQRAIDDSRRRRDFKARDKGRTERTQKREGKERNKYVQRGVAPNKRVKTDEEDPQVSEAENSDEELKRVMDQEDPELERDLQVAADEDDSDNMDEEEFLNNADGLDLPDEEDEEDFPEDDLKGDDTDSELEDYYRELGIDNEQGKPYKK